MVEVGIVKPQTRPVIVEIKRKRGVHDRERSIWSGIDLTAAAAKVDAEMEEIPDKPPVDSGAPSTDVENRNQPKVEQEMPDPQEAETAETVAETPAIVKEPEPKKKAPRPKKAKAASKPRVAKETVKPATKTVDARPAAARAKRKVYSKNERAQILATIEKATVRGVSIKTAVSEAGVSEQTYYHWKKAVGTAAAPADLNDLIALEEENKQLKKQLAERLRQENAELKKKLGLR